MPRLWILSDLHLENRPEDIVSVLAAPDFDILVVAGDIYESDPARGVREVARLADGKPAVVCLGNHCLYGLDIVAAIEAAVEEGQRCGVHVLERSIVAIDGLTFVGGTLWPDHYGARGTHVAPDLSKVMAGEEPALLAPPPHLPFEGGILAGGRQPRLATFQDMQQIHEQTLNAIELAQADIVVTHYPPTELARSLAGSARLWINGHKHEFSREIAGEIEFVQNPRQARVFAPKMVIELPAIEIEPAIEVMP